LKIEERIAKNEKEQKILKTLIEKQERKIYYNHEKWNKRMLAWSNRLLTKYYILLDDLEKEHDSLAHLKVCKDKEKECAELGKKHHSL
jgi:hypothetical protein